MLKSKILYAFAVALLSIFLIISDISYIYNYDCELMFLYPTTIIIIIVIIFQLMQYNGAENNNWLYLLLCGIRLILFGIMCSFVYISYETYKQDTGAGVMLFFLSLIFAIFDYILLYYISLKSIIYVNFINNNIVLLYVAIAVILLSFQKIYCYIFLQLAILQAFYMNCLSIQYICEF